MAGKEQFTFQSVQHQPLSARKWVPEGPFRGIVQLVHGMAEHIRRYEATAKALNEAGLNDYVSWLMPKLTAEDRKKAEELISQF